MSEQRIIDFLDNPLRQFTPQRDGATNEERANVPEPQGTPQPSAESTAPVSQPNVLEPLLRRPTRPAPIDSNAILDFLNQAAPEEPVAEPTPAAPLAPGEPAIPEPIVPRLTTEPRATEDVGTAATGLARRALAGGVQLINSLRTLTALGADVIGLDDVSKRIFTEVKADNDAAQRGLSTPDFPEKVEDVLASDNPTRAAGLFVLGTIANQVPNLAAIFAGGGLGASLEASVAAGAITAQQAKSILFRLAERGTVVGVGTAAGGLETAATAEELFDATGRIRPGIALSAGIVKGALETVTPLTLARRVGLDINLGRKFLGELTTKLTQGGPGSFVARLTAAEATTETLQEVVDLVTRNFVDENFELLGPETASRLLNAAVAGGILGAAFGTAGAVATRNRGETQPINAAERERMKRERQPVAPQPAQGELFPPDELGITPGAVDPDGQLNFPGFAPADQGVVGPDADVAPGQLDLFDQAIAMRESQLGFEFVQPAETPLGSGFAVLTEGMELTPTIAAGSFFGGVDSANQQLGANPNARLMQVDLRKVPSRAVTKELSSLPGTFEEFLKSDFEILPGGNRQAALDNVRIALDARNRLGREQVDTTLSAEQTETLDIQSQAAYDTAIEAGLRVRPTKFSDIRVLEDIPSSALREVATPTGGVVPRDSFVTTGFSPVSPLSHQTAELTMRDGSKREVLLPLSRISLDNATTGTPVETLLRGQVFSVNESLLDPNDVTAQTPSMAQRGAILLAETPDDPRLARNGIRFIDPELQNEALRALKKSEPLGRLVDLGVRITPGPQEARVILNPEAAFANLVPESLIPQLGRQPIEGFANINTYAARSAVDLQKTLDAVDEVVMDINGKVVTETVPGRAYILGWGSDSDAFGFVEPSRRSRPNAILRKTARTYQKLMDRFGYKDATILLSPINAVTHPVPGFFSATASGTHVIHIDTSGLSLRGFLTRVGSDDILSTVFHEFGHFIHWQELRNAPPALLDAVYNAFMRSNRRFASTGDTRRFTTEIRSATRILSGGDQISDSFVAWWDFDEWFAEQVARWSQTSDVAMTVVDSFFKRVALRVRRAINEFFSTRQLGEFGPVQEIRTLLDDLVLQRETAGLEPKSRSAFLLNTNESRLDNEIALDNDSMIKLSPPIERQGPTRRVEQISDTNLMEFGLHSKNELIAKQDYWNRLVKYGFNLFQLADRNKHISGLQRYREAVDRAYVYKMNLVSRGDERISEWRELDRAQHAPLARYLFDLTQTKYLEEGAAPRQPTDAERAELAREHGLTQEALFVARRIEDDFTVVIDAMEEALLKEARENFVANEEVLERETLRIRTEMSELKSRPYFPMMRFGRHTVTVRNADDNVIWHGQEETKRAADRLFKQAKRQFPNDSVGQSVLKDEQLAMRGMPPSVVRALVLNKVSNLTEEQVKELEEITFEFSPEGSFAQRLRRRKNIPGFSEDAIRAYATYFSTAPNHLMRMQFRGELAANVRQIERSAAEIAKTQDASKRTEIQNFVQDHMNVFLNPLADWANLRAFAFHFHLGAAIDSVALNLTQVPMVGAPYLASRFGDARSLAALTTAVKDVQLIYRSKTNPRLLNPEKLQAIDEAMKQGFIDASMATELASIAQGSNLERALPGTRVGRLGKMSSHWSSYLFQQSEKLNRNVMFGATYELAMTAQVAGRQGEYFAELAELNATTMTELRAKGFTEQNALAFLAGKDAVQRTMFEYAAHARPRFMRGKLATPFVFFMFTQNMLFYARFSPGAGRYLLLLAATAGLMGLPGMEDLFSIADGIGKRLGWWDNGERAVRKFIKDLDIVDNPDTILHGISSKSFGMAQLGDAIGVPIPSVDFSRRIGVGQVLPVQDIGNLIAPGARPESTLFRAAEGAAGAAFSIPINLYKSLVDGHPDIFQRWNRTLPRSFRNVTKAWRTYNRGGVENRQGAQVARFDPSDPDEASELIAMSLGFNPTRLAKAWSVRRMQQESAIYWSVQKSLLLSQFDYARRTRNADALADVRRQIARYNNELPFRSMGIRGRDLRASLLQRARSRVLIERGLLTNRREIPLSREILSLFPDVEADLLRQQERQFPSGPEVLSDEPVR